MEGYIGIYVKQNIQIKGSEPLRNMLNILIQSLIHADMVKVVGG